MTLKETCGANIQ